MSTASLRPPRRTTRSLPAKALAARLAERPVLVVGTIVLVWALILGHYAAKVSEWLVMTDELQYVKLALGITQTGNPLPTLRGEPYGAYNQLYPLVISPVLGLFDMPDAFRGVHRLNGLLMASTAIPAYLLARATGLARIPSYVAGALCVGVPWAALTIIIMTENVAYPAFTWALVGIVVAVARPSARHDLLALAGVLLATLARTQFILLAGVLPAVVVLHEAGWRLTARRTGVEVATLRDTVRRHAVLVAACVAGALVLAALVASGRHTELLGGYTATIEQGSILPSGTLRTAEVHLALVTVGLGVVPVVLGGAWLLTTLAVPLGKAQHALAVAALVLVPVLAIQVASFNIRFAGGAVQTRYLFYVAPLFFVGTMWALASGRRVWPVAAALSVVVFLLVGLGNYLTAGGPFFSSPETAFYKVLDGRSYQLGLKLLGEPLRGSQTVPWLALAGGLLGAAALALVPRRPLLICASVLLVAAMGLQTRSVIRTMLYGPNGSRPVSGTQVPGRDWVDEALPDGARAALLPMPLANFGGAEADRAYYQQQLWWDVEFWNKSVDRTYGFEDYERFTVFHVHPIALDATTGALDTTQPRPYVVTSDSNLRFGIAGEVAGRAPSGHAELVRADQPLRASWSLAGLGGDGYTGSDPVRLRLYPRRGNATAHALRVQLAPPDGMEAPRRYRLRGGGASARGAILPGEPAVASLDVCVRAPTDVTLHVPAGTELDDGRRVGLRVRQVADTLGGC